MIPLALGVAIFGVHTRFTHLETDASPLLAALGTAVGHRHVTQPTTGPPAVDAFLAGPLLGAIFNLAN
jgi:hypothetical protein